MSISRSGRPRSRRPLAIGQLGMHATKQDASMELVNGMLAQGKLTYFRQAAVPSQAPVARRDFPCDFRSPRTGRETRCTCASTPLQFGEVSGILAPARMVQKLSRRARALKRAGLGMDSTRFSVEFIRIKGQAGEAGVAANWPVCRRPGWKVP